MSHQREALQAMLKENETTQVPAGSQDREENRPGEKEWIEWINPGLRVYRLLIGVLSAIVIIAMLGMIIAWLIRNKNTMPDSILALAAFSLGMLVGIFVAVPANSMEKHILRSGPKIRQPVDSGEMDGEEEMAGKDDWPQLP